MDQNQGMVQALMRPTPMTPGGAPGGAPSMPGWANPEIQQSGMGQPQGPLGQLQGMRTQAQQYMHDPNNPIGKMLGQFGQSQMPQMPWGRMPQAPGMLGGQPPIMPGPAQPQTPGTGVSMNPGAQGMGDTQPMSPYGASQPRMMG